MHKQDMPQNGAQIKSRKRKTCQDNAWYKRYPRDFTDGTKGLSLEEKGAYHEVIEFIYIHDQPIIDDLRDIAHRLQIDIRLWKRLRGQLIAKGKLYITADGRLSNERADEELAERRVRNGRRSGKKTTPQLSDSYGLAKPQLGVQVKKIPNEINGSCAQIQSQSQIQNNKDKTTSVVASTPREATALPGYDDLKKKLIEAGGARLADEASAPSLANLSLPMTWLESGLDLDRDVVPTIRRVVAKKGGPVIRAWEYFHQAMAEDYAKRLKGLPTVNLQVVAPTQTFYDFDVAKAYKKQQAELMSKPLVRRLG